MARSILVGGGELAAAHRRAGQIIDACARLEEAISYLEWQLTAYAWDKDHPQATQAVRQTALRAERANWDRYQNLDGRLTRVTHAFENAHVSGRVRRDERLQQLRRDWETLRERARSLGLRRNEVVHTVLGWSNGKVIRQIGRPWKQTTVVSDADDDTLWSELGNMANEIGAYTTELGQRLPFADDDQIIA
jgi:multidrug efflux pump subunit AcrB